MVSDPRPWARHAGPGVAAVVGGCALALAFPGTDWSGVAWLALAPLFAITVSTPPRSGFGWGWLAGTVFFLALLRWLDHTFRLYSSIPWPLTWLPIAALAAYCGLYVGLVAATASWLARRAGPGLALAAVPFAWVVAEWLRGVVLGGFPWGLMGYSQHATLRVIQIAELGGVYMVSFLVIAVNAAAAGLAALPWPRAAAGAAGAGVLLLATLGFGTARLAGVSSEVASIALVQPSIDQALKWDPAHQAASVGVYLRLTDAAMAGRPDLVVWPETAAPTVLRRDPDLRRVLEGLVSAGGAPILVGSIDVSDAPPPRYYNSAFLLSEQGIIGRYDKIHLVPFGEFVPLSGVIGFVRGWAGFIADLEPGPGPVVFPGPPAPFGVIICYEGIFPELVRDFVRGGARFMVNMTNDAWFGRTSGPRQHLAMYPLRAVEHRIAIARAANTGVSAFITPNGRIASQAELYERGVLRGRVALRTRETLYTRFGDWFVYGCMAVSGAAGALAVSGRRRRAE